VQERALWLLASLAGVVLLVAALKPYLHKDEPAAEVAEGPTLSEIVHVAVFNGCGEAHLAARMTKRARSLGLDVILEGNADSFSYLESIVIDRGGDLSRARQVADLLGIPNCIQQISDDTYRMEDVAIIIGKDYKRLQLLGP